MLSFPLDRTEPAQVSGWTLQHHSSPAPQYPQNIIMPHIMGTILTVTHKQSKETRMEFSCLIPESLFQH